MKKYIFIPLLIIIVLSTVYLLDIFGEPAGFRPEMIVKGDVANLINLKDYRDIDKVKIDYEGESLNVFKLKDIIQQAQPVADAFDVIYSADDGLKARLSDKNLDDCYINFSKENGWEAINPKYPVSSNVKYLEEIIVRVKKDDLENSFNIISPEDNFVKTTPGQLLTDRYISYSHFEGASTVTNDGRDYKAGIYTTKRIVDLDNLIFKKLDKDAMVINKRGEALSYGEGMLEISGNQINYIDPENEKELTDCQGIIIDPPVKRNADVFYDSLYYLSNGKRVMVILLDGFGFYQYQSSSEKGYLPFLSKQKKAEKALSAYKPVTNTGLAAVLTGHGPGENGIYSREFMDLLIPDLFEKADGKGFSSSYIEGNIKILNTSIEPILNPDLNKNGSTDDEVFNSTVEEIKGESDLIFAHFHGIDDSGHTYGPLAEETLSVIERTDSYLERLVQIWSGKVIITVDHGMHKTAQGGDHGSLVYQDMFVPYWILDGEDIDE